MLSLAIWCPDNKLMKLYLKVLYHKSKARFSICTNTVKELRARKKASTDNNFSIGELYHKVSCPQKRRAGLIFGVT